ncbi:MAG: protein-L-isoaspartate O-methyltransferase, partial [Ottowia sp.]|nr:protein-L-isoaspartate O-methyltransferase [Ottowia sp.]
QRVLTLEIDNDLAQTAHANLHRAGVLNVEVRVADGASTDLSADGPFDVIVLSGSVAQLPDAVLGLLKAGGRLMAIVGDEPVMRATLVQQSGNGLVSTQPWDCNVPRLLNFPEPSRFHF